MRGGDAQAQRIEADAKGVETRRLAPRERDALLAWLDDGLRGGRAGRLAAETPDALADPEAVHAVARADGRPVSHALGRLVRAHAAGRTAAVGLVALVYTDPAFRGRGLARACVAAVGDHLDAAGALALALWSDRDGLYEPLGFRTAGTAWRSAIDASLCREARASERRFEVGAPRRDEFDRLERLHAAHATRIERAPGALARATAAPDCETRVARQAGVALAYASAGRGDDLRGVAHEWAGDPDGVLACLETLCSEAHASELLAPSLDGPIGLRLRALGTPSLRGPLARIHVPAPVRLWEALVGADPVLAGVRLTREGAEFRLDGTGGTVALSYEEAVALLLGPVRPARAASALTPGEFLALREALPWPLFFWGFDSL